MLVQSLEITNFRNFHNVEVNFDPGVNVLCGNNGAGKTNLLEAIFTTCLGRSQKTAKDNTLVNSQADYYRLAGKVIVPGNEIDVAVAYERGGRKKITLGGAPVRASELYEKLALVASGPEDSEILAGAPSARRLFLDIYLSQLSQIYLADLTDYQRVVAQKNAALKREMDPEPFNPLIVSLGARIMQARKKFLQDLGAIAKVHYADVADDETLGIEYRPKVRVELEGRELVDIETAFEDTLNVNRERERVMRTSLVGPHRDEVEFSINELPARTHGSRGQWRAVAVSLKLAVYELLKQKRGHPPLLLLDEIFAELDRGRAEHLIAKFFDIEQLFLTTAIYPPESLLSGARLLTIENGKITGDN